MLTIHLIISLLCCLSHQSIGVNISDTNLASLVPNYLSRLSEMLNNILTNIQGSENTYKSINWSLYNTPSSTNVETFTIISYCISDFNLNSFQNLIKVHKDCKNDLVCQHKILYFIPETLPYQSNKYINDINMLIDYFGSESVYIVNINDLQSFSGILFPYLLVHYKDIHRYTYSRLLFIDYLTLHYHINHHKSTDLSNTHDEDVDQRPVNTTDTPDSSYIWMVDMNIKWIGDITKVLSRWNDANMYTDTGIPSSGPHDPRGELSYLAAGSVTSAFINMSTVNAILNTSLSSPSYEAQACATASATTSAIADQPSIHNTDIKPTIYTAIPVQNKDPTTTIKKGIIFRCIHLLSSTYHRLYNRSKLLLSRLLRFLFRRTQTHHREPTTSPHSTIATATPVHSRQDTETASSSHITDTESADAAAGSLEPAVTVCMPDLIRYSPHALETLHEHFSTILQTELNLLESSVTASLDLSDVSKLSVQLDNELIANTLLDRDPLLNIATLLHINSHRLTDLLDIGLAEDLLQADFIPALGREAGESGRLREARQLCKATSTQVVKEVAIEYDAVSMSATSLSEPSTSDADGSEAQATSVVAVDEELDTSWFSSFRPTRRAAFTAKALLVISPVIANLTQAAGEVSLLVEEAAEKLSSYLSTHPSFTSVVLTAVQEYEQVVLHWRQKLETDLATAFASHIKQSPSYQASVDLNGDGLAVNLSTLIIQDTILTPSRFFRQQLLSHAYTPITEYQPQYDKYATSSTEPSHTLPSMMAYLFPGIIYRNVTDNEV